MERLTLATFVTMLSDCKSATTFETVGAVELILDTKRTYHRIPHRKEWNEVIKP